MKFVQQKGSVISQQLYGLCKFSLPLLFYNYNNLTTTDFGDNQSRSQFYYFNSHFLLRQRDRSSHFSPLFYGSFLIKPVSFSSLDSRLKVKIFPIFVVLDPYIITYARFEQLVVRCSYSLVNLSCISFLHNMFIIPFYLFFIRCYQLLLSFFILRNAYTKSIT